MSNEVAPASDYASILRNSIHRETIARMVCSGCRQTNHLRIKRVIGDAALPPVLVINAGVRTAGELEFWVDGRLASGVRFVQPRFSIGKLGTGETMEVKNLARSDPVPAGAIGYELRVSGSREPSQCTLTDLCTGHGRPDSVRRGTAASSRVDSRWVWTLSPWMQSCSYSPFHRSLRRRRQRIVMASIQRLSRAARNRGRSSQLPERLESASTR